MIKKQFRNRAYACLNSEMVGGFPPYTIDGLPVPEHSICEVMDDDTLRVVAVYKLHQEQWYRYDLVSVWPPYPPQPEPLQKTISLGLVVPEMPTTPIESVSVLAPTPVSISSPALAVPAMPTITESTT